MTEYTIDLNGKRYRLSDEFRQSLEERAEIAYEDNPVFECWWSVAKRENYSDDAWEQNIHEEGDPILTIETEGPMVPWDDLDQLEATMPGELEQGDILFSDEQEPDELDSGGDMKSIEPESFKSSKDIFGRTHFTLTPHRFEEVPEPGGDDPDKIPPKPREIGDEPEMMIWAPSHPEMEHTWETGEAIVSASSWVEWNVQQRANQTRPSKKKGNSHDSFESLCRIYDCEVVGEYTPSNDISEGKSGSVERKGEKAFEDGRYGGSNWRV
jgi:hypothetical protein